jgi:hypothetical protein
MNTNSSYTFGFLRACKEQGLLTRRAFARRKSGNIGFVSETSLEVFAAIITAASSYDDLLACWKWAPKKYEAKLLAKLRSFDPPPEEEYRLSLLASPENKWTLSPEAEEVQKHAKSKARPRDRYVR